MTHAQKTDYLRISVTDQCNLNCLYCSPCKIIAPSAREDLLSLRDMERIVRAFVALGVRSVRITGGEPLLRKDAVDVVGMLRRLPRLSDLSLTTNGVCLEEIAPDLAAAGLDRINVSLDTLDKKKYHKITSADQFERVWRGIMGAVDAQLHPVKINVVVMRGMNDDELIDFARLTLRYPLHVRFIEFFPNNERSRKLMHLVMTNAQVKQRIKAHFGRLSRDYNVEGKGPAEYYRISGALGSVGFISSFSSNFCDQCNRSRVDCAGRILPCLFSEDMFDLRNPLREDNDDALIASIRNVLRIKDQYTKNTRNNVDLNMSAIGG